MTTNYKLTEEQFNKLMDDNTSVGEFKQLTELVTQRFEYIIEQIAKIVGRTVHWFDYDNEGGENNPGSFDPISYNKNIWYFGDISATVNENFQVYDDSFPTVWLKEDFEEKLKQEVAQFVQDEKETTNKEQAKKDALHAKMKAMHTQIMAKLTPEEQSYIQCKPFKQIHEEYLKEQQKKDKEEKHKQKQKYIAEQKAKKAKP